jgi:hypothetical protein
MIAVNHCVVWTPALIFLLIRSQGIDLRSSYGIWCFAAGGVFVISLWFDYRDAMIYPSIIL